MTTLDELQDQVNELKRRHRLLDQGIERVERALRLLALETAEAGA